MVRRHTLFARCARNAVVGLAIAVMAAAASPVDADARGRVALVLSGGGAAGAAHVGVIEALENVGIRPSCVVGTSMGAIVGGLYATGMPVEEMKEVVQTVDWLALLDDNSDRSVVHPMRRRPRVDPRNIFVPLPLGADKEGVRTDAGLVDGNRLLLILRELTLPAATITSFDELPIPFRAVATELASGEVRVLGEGDLALALRASMSLPGIFPPVVKNGDILVDGGVANNLPIDVGIQMCADEPTDTVIAVTIPQSEPDVNSLTTFTGALGQTLSLMIRDSTNDQLAMNAGRYELLTPQVQNIGTLDFARIPEAMDIGFNSTKDDIVGVAALVRERRAAAGSAFEAPLPGATALAPLGATRGGITATNDGLGEELRIDAIDIENDTGYSDEVIRAYVDIQPPTVITTLELSERLERLYGLGAFDLVSYRVEPGNRLVIIARKQESGNIEFRIGSAFEDSFDGRAIFTFGGGVGFTQLDELGRRIDIDAAIGSSQLAAIAIEQPLDYAQTWFVTGDAAYYAFRAPVNVSPDDRRADYWLRTALFGASLNYAPIETLRFSAGPFYRWRRAELSTGDPGQFPSNTQTDNIGGRFTINVDTLDDQELPTRGLSLDTALFVEGEEAFDGVFAGTLELDALAAYPVPFGTVQAFVRGSGEVGDAEERIGFARIGGFQRLSGFERDGFVGNVAGVVGLRGIARADFLEGFFGVAGFAGAGVEYGGFYEGWSDIDEETSFVAGSAFVGLDTRLGPVYLGFGYAEAGNGAVYLGFGERF